MLSKFAILGRPNAGKSTLINKILKMNICDSSSKSHTTKFPIKASFTHGNTQIVFVDTPGLVTKKEFSKFELDDSIVGWEQNVLNEVDMIGLICELPYFNTNIKYHKTLIRKIRTLKNPKPIFLILNKYDVIKQYSYVGNSIDNINKALEKENESDEELPKIEFSKIFHISALKNLGVDRIVDYLLSEAKESDWILDDNVCDKPPTVIITSLLRAKVMDLLPKEVPYQCSFEVEYLEENDYGELVCVALVRCKKLKHLKLALTHRKNKLKKLVRNLESDLFIILGKVIRLRVVFVSDEINKDKRQNVLQNSRSHG
ncbi:GTP-binding protein era, putative [Pediculus humanus corporis]|uniref:GTPase Era, mitochondrial n=1 Tax=Pediculus humanus subsp. corporis TaxID=121224 RepID=E0VBK2_PEDHC|nr:GTP-binding protein era, putative [Pediculus humanus corporis]EEB10758.1 GTP-binding protein era, putative [Pediculus humanus corporis]